jgi:hypothetical protein
MKESNPDFDISEFLEAAYELEKSDSVNSSDQESSQSISMSTSEQAVPTDTIKMVLYNKEEQERMNKLIKQE